MTAESMNRADTFSPSFFEILKKAEEKYFWFNVRRKWIFDTIAKFIPPPARILEVGCGTGNVSSYLAGQGYDVTGCEYYDEALSMAWPGFEKIKGDATNLPFKDHTFDIVCLFDVIEHFDDDVVPLREAKRVVKKNGIITITVPAREELWSYVDDEAYHKRRYTRNSLARVLSDSGLAPLLMDYMFMTLYYPIKYLRRKKRVLVSEHFRINPFANRFLGLLFDAERNISRFLPLPLGTSLIAVAKKSH